MKTPYHLSKDYDLLYDLVKGGFEIPCWFYPYPDKKGYIKKDVGKIQPDLSIGFRHDIKGCFFAYTTSTGEKDVFINKCRCFDVEFIQPTLIVGELIIADIIGLGIYEIVSFSDYHVNVKVKKIFGEGWIYRNHQTNCHNRPSKIDLVKWLSYKRVRK